MEWATVLYQIILLSTYKNINLKAAKID